MDDEYLRSCSKGMMESIRAFDPEGIWLTQTWVFIDFRVWTKEKVSAFLSGVEGSDSMILLDLMSDLQPVYDKSGDNKKKVGLCRLIKRSSFGARCPTSAPSRDSTATSSPLRRVR